MRKAHFMTGMMPTHQCQHSNGKKHSIRLWDCEDLGVFRFPVHPRLAGTAERVSWAHWDSNRDDARGKPRLQWKSIPARVPAAGEAEIDGALGRERPVHSRADLLIVVGDIGAMGTCGFAKVPQLGWFLRSQAS